MSTELYQVQVEKEEMEQAHVAHLTAAFPKVLIDLDLLFRGSLNSVPRAGGRLGTGELGTG